REPHVVPAQPHGDWPRHACALNGQGNELAFIAADALHDVLGRLVFGALPINGNDRISIPQSSPVCGAVRIDREYVNPVVDTPDIYADAIEMAALFVLKIVKFGFGEEV